MSEEIKQIAERLVGLRDALDLKPEEIAAACHIDLEATSTSKPTGDTSRAKKIFP